MVFDETGAPSRLTGQHDGRAVHSSAKVNCLRVAGVRVERSERLFAAPQVTRL